MNWFSADYHLGHSNIIKYCNRPFKNTAEMDDYIIKVLKQVSKPGDKLYYLGDLTFKEKIARGFFREFEYLEIHYIIGNHDNSKVLKLAEENCASVSQIKHIKLNNQPLTLCHYAMRVWPKSHFNAWQLYGHSHGRLQPLGKQYDVGVDNNQFIPRSFEEIKEIMKSQPNNINYISPQERI